MGRHIVTAPAAVLEKLPALGVKTAAKLSLNVVKVCRDDAVSVALTLSVMAPGAAEWPV